MALATPINRVRTRGNTLAKAASGYVTTPNNNDPFDLIRRGSSIPGAPAPPSSTPVPPTPASVSTSTGSAPGGGAAPPPSAPQYDLSADPVLQQVQAAAAQGDAAAQGSALAARQQALLAYGDPTLAASVLGASDPVGQAAGSNPESTLARLKRGYGQNLWQFDNTLDPSLVYSGARIRGEGQLGQTYQDNLASAAAAIQSQLGGINDQLNAAEAADADKVSGAYADAYNRAVQQYLANPPATDPSTLAALAAIGG